MLSESVDILCTNTDALIDFMVVTLNNIIPISDVSRHHDKKDQLPVLEQFVDDFFKQCTNDVSTSVIVFALIYLKRIQHYIPSNSYGEVETPYRLFVSSILISSKYLCEAGTNLTSKTVSKYISFIFSHQEINRMERGFLGLIKYDLWVSNIFLEDFIKKYGNQLQLQLADVILYDDIAMFQNNQREYLQSAQKSVLHKMMHQKKKIYLELTPPIILSSPVCSSPLHSLKLTKKSNKIKISFFNH